MEPEVFGRLIDGLVTGLVDGLVAPLLKTVPHGHGEVSVVHKSIHPGDVEGCLCLEMKDYMGEPTSFVLLHLPWASREAMDVARYSGDPATRVMAMAVGVLVGRLREAVLVVADNTAMKKGVVPNCAVPNRAEPEAVPANVSYVTGPEEL